MKKNRSVNELIKRRSFRQFMGLFLQYKHLYVTVLILQLGVTVSVLLFAETTRRMFDLVPNIENDVLITLVIAFFGFIVMGLVLSLLEQIFNQILNTNVVFQMRLMVVTHLTRLSLSYHENKHSSNSHNILHNELEMFKQFVVFDVLKLITLPISFIIVGIYLVTVHPVLGIVAVSVGPLQLISNLVFKERYKDIARDQNNIGKHIFFHMGEIMSGIREVKMNRLEHSVHDKFKYICQQGINYYVAFEKVIAYRNIIRQIPEKIGFLAGISVGAVLIVDGQIGAGGLIAFITLLDRISIPFASLVDTINSLQRAVTGAEKLFDVMEMAPENGSSGMELDGSPPAIRFENVSFAYDQGSDVLRNICFSIPANAAVALVGPSGSGKSTILKLLYRFYDVQDGSIFINNHPIQEYSLDLLRGNMSAVLQDIYLFDGTIRENIAIGSLTATEDDIKRAAELSQAHSFIARLPDMFDTQVEERGIKLSQGQKQRIAIARAVLRDAPILILDEPTSALDIETETFFQRDLDEWAGASTKIIIAHRLSTIRDVDYILFLEDGEIVEQGTPEQLLSHAGRFKTFWDNQTADTFIS